MAFANEPDRIPNLIDPPAGTPPKALPESEPVKHYQRNPWEDLWRRLPLNVEDHEALQKKRGFSAETLKWSGLRSNRSTFRSIVEALEERWSISHLVAEGIYKEEGRQRPGPAGQLCGYGITNEKDENGDPIFGLTEPPIIPYFDEQGMVIYLRPHKGGVKKPKTDIEEAELCEDEDDERHCSSLVYIPPGTADLVQQA